jgi:nitrate/TMAO reductase-like tetraheme cytochrome c subunit
VQVNIDPAYATPWKTAYLTNSANGMSSTTMICAKCHDLNGTTSKFSNSVHSDGEHQGSSAGQCILCHVQVPHGWVRPRLLGVTTDPYDAAEAQELHADQLERVRLPDVMW